MFGFIITSLDVLADALKPCCISVPCSEVLTKRFFVDWSFGVFWREVSVQAIAGKYDWKIRVRS